MCVGPAYDLRSGRQRKEEQCWIQEFQIWETLSQKGGGYFKARNTKQNKKINIRKKITKKNGVMVDLNCQFDESFNHPAGWGQAPGHAWKGDLDYATWGGKDSPTHTCAGTRTCMYAHICANTCTRWVARFLGKDLELYTKGEGGVSTWVHSSLFLDSYIQHDQLPQGPAMVACNPELWPKISLCFLRLLLLE